MNLKSYSLCAALVLGTLGAPSVASAAALPFCVTDAYKAGFLDNTTACNGVAPGTTGFSADLLNGAYNEKILVEAGGPTGLTFNATILAKWGQFVFDGQGLDGTGLGNTYQLYAVVYASGVITGANSFTSTAASFDLFFSQEGGANATTLGLNDIDDFLTGGRLLFTGDNGVADTLVGSSTTLISGTGTTSASAGTDGFAVTFGEFELSAFGENFFIAPRPFYLNIYSDGDINDGSVEIVAPGLLSIQGDLSAEFRAVPEPTSLALAALALLGLGAASRRNAKV